MTTPAHTATTSYDADAGSDLQALLAVLQDDPEHRAAMEDAAETSRLLRALRQIRDETGVSQQTVATRMGTRQSAVSVIEGGARDLQLSTLLRYARAVGVRVRLLPTVAGDEERGGTADARPDAWLKQQRRGASSARVCRYRPEGRATVAPNEWHSRAAI